MGYSMAHDTIGVGMVNRAVANVDVKGRGYLKGPDLPKGFMQSLIDNGQGGDVYHHIEFVAGNSFLGTSGRVANAAFIGVDFRQAKSGRRESITELRDDLAGLQAGKAMLAAYNRGKFDNLDATLRGILCVPE